MNRMARAAVLCSLGMVTLRLIWSGGYGWFVQQHMRLPLLAGGVILLALGLVEAWAASREERSDPDSIRRSAGPAVGLMLMLPLLGCKTPEVESPVVSNPKGLFTALVTSSSISAEVSVPEKPNNSPQ